MTPRHLLAMAAALLLLAGCGAEPAPGPTVRNPHPWTEQQVLDAAGLSTDDNGLSYHTASGCYVPVVLTNAAAVELYAAAGDTVVTNPAGTAGVKTSGAKPGCLAELKRGLAALK